MQDQPTKPLVHHLIILDESGSMSSVRAQTIQTFNDLMSRNDSLVAEYPDQEHRLTFITFNSKGIRTVCFDKPLSEPVRLSDETYVPNEGTPLWDAMGSSMLKVKHHLYGHPDHRVLVTVITDGMENASREFSGKEIKRMVDELKEKNWVIVYLGTDHDIHGMADAMGERYGNRMQWDKANMHDAMSMIHDTRMTFSKRMMEKRSLMEDLLKEAAERQKEDTKG